MGLFLPQTSPLQRPTLAKKMGSSNIPLHALTEWFGIATDRSIIIHYI